MELSYIGPQKTTIVVHLAAGEQLGNLGSPEVGIMDFIKVDGNDPNYVELLKQDPYLDSVADPTQMREGELNQAQANDIAKAKADAEERGRREQRPGNQGSGGYGGQGYYSGEGAQSSQQMGEGQLQGQQPYDPRAGHPQISQPVPR